MSSCNAGLLHFAIAFCCLLHSLTFVALDLMSLILRCLVWVLNVRVWGKIIALLSIDSVASAWQLHAATPDLLHFE